MKIAFIFPGQGAQYVGMGKDLYDNYDEIRELYNKANEILGLDIAKLTFELTEEELCKTSNTQITILLMSLGILKILEENNINAQYTAGLSLGEYISLIYSKFIGINDGIKIVRKRGELMQDCKGDWKMAAIIRIRI